MNGLVPSRNCPVCPKTCLNGRERFSTRATSRHLFQFMKRDLMRRLSSVHLHLSSLGSSVPVHLWRCPTNRSEMSKIVNASRITCARMFGHRPNQRSVNLYPRLDSICMSGSIYCLCCCGRWLICIWLAHMSWPHMHARTNVSTLLCCSSRTSVGSSATIVHLSDGLFNTSAA
jgi:hypothetical protein